jgi:hypothetical protein
MRCSNFLRTAHRFFSSSALEGVGDLADGVDRPLWLLTSLLGAIDQLAPAAVVIRARTRDTAESALLGRVIGHVPLLCAAGQWPTDMTRRCIATTDLTATVQTVSDWMRPNAHHGEQP